MVSIINIRPVILTAAYGFEGCAENSLHLPEGLRSCSMVEITLSNGIKGIGEGYLGVFAPEVFRTISELIGNAIKGSDLSNGYQHVVTKAKNVTAYWSLQGAAQHVISAIEIALVDAYSKYLNVPAIELFGGSKVKSIPMYGSGGDSLAPKYMARELELLAERGIKTIKIRARHNQVDKTIWTINEAKKFGIRVAVDMTQNLAVEGQTPSNVRDFHDAIFKKTGEKLVFVEECLGLDKHNQLPELTVDTDIVIAGGEIVTTKEELFTRIDDHYYNIVQPDASVLGGISDTIDICRHAQNQGVRPVVHSWGGPVSMMANYIAAFATNCDLIEFPMPRFEIRDEMFNFDSFIKDGELSLPEKPGIGIELTEEIEKRFPYQEKSIYHCSPLESGLKELEESHKTWAE
ncbi:enolase C-terminal domain-like protein [Vibrio splendidus]